MQHADAVAEPAIVLAVDRGADFFSPPGPLSDLAVVLPLVGLWCRHAAELPPDAERDQRARIPDHQHRLEQQLFDPLRGNLRRAERPHPLAQLWLVALGDRRGEPHEIPSLRIETVLFRRHPVYLGEGSLRRRISAGAITNTQKARHAPEDSKSSHPGRSDGTTHRAPRSYVAPGPPDTLRADATIPSRPRGRRRPRRRVGPAVRSRPGVALPSARRPPPATARAPHRPG